MEYVDCKTCGEGMELIDSCLEPVDPSSGREGFRQECASCHSDHFYFPTDVWEGRRRES